MWVGGGGGNVIPGNMPSSGKKNRFPFLGILGNSRVFKEYAQKSQIWKSETSPNQGTWLGIPWLGLVSLCQIWHFYGYSLSTLKYPKMGSRYFFLCYWQIVSHGQRDL